jgi:hypothetical protein
MKMTPPMTATTQQGFSSGPPFLRRRSLFMSSPPRTESNESITPVLDGAPVVSSPRRIASETSLSLPPVSTIGQSSFRQVLSSKVTQAGSFLRRQHTLLRQKTRDVPFRTQSELSDDKRVSNSLSDATGLSSPQVIGSGSERMAGEPQVYDDIKVSHQMCSKSS